MPAGRVPGSKPARRTAGGVQLVLTSISLQIFHEYGGASHDINLKGGNLSNPFSRFPAIGFLPAVTLCSQSLNPPAGCRAGQYSNWGEAPKFSSDCLKHKLESI